MKNLLWLLAALCPLSLSAAAAGAEPAAPPRLVDGIMDNSFLIEEAYNQEPGVVQHIFTTSYSVTRSAGQEDHGWVSTFTQEWPIFSQRHQFSYTIPWSNNDAGGRRQTDLNDILLNYRYQVYFDAETLTGFAPRL